MNTKLPSLLLAATISSMSFAAPVLGQTADIQQVAVQLEDGADARINFSGKLRMLSQFIPAAGCRLFTQTGSDTTIPALDGAIAEFDSILNALEFGDDGLGIPNPEERRKTLAALAEVRSHWEPMKTAAQAIETGEGGVANLQVLFDENALVLSSAQDLVTEISGQYSNPAEMVSAEAFLIDIAGRQRMLIQVISKESCTLTTDLATAETDASLESAMQIFTNTLDALRNGMPSAGIRRPPTAQIAAGLESVSDQWVEIKPTLEAVRAGTAVDADTRAQTFDSLNAMMGSMNAVVGLYAAATQ